MINIDPRFTIIIPVYNVEGWIRACLDSVREQTFMDFEAIVVDDESADSSIRIVHEFLRDPRFRLIRHERNQGLGPARNTGLDAARGSYVVFLDSDDVLEPEALELIDDRARQLEDPDVVIFDYCRLNWWGSLVRNQNAHLLESCPDSATSLDEVPDLLSNFHVAWNKAYRRDFIRDAGLRFPPGYYEDVPWTYPVLIRAKTIGLLPEALYQYRQRWAGSILKDKSNKHFDLFDQYDRLFAAIDEIPGAERWQARLYRQMFDHYRALIRTGMNRIPKESKARYFERTAASLRTHRPEVTSEFSGLDRLRLHGLSVGHDRMYSVLKFAYQRSRRTWWAIRRTVRRRIRRIVNTRFRFYRWAHRMAVRLPGDDHLAIYMSYWGRSYSCNPRAIYEAQRRLRPDIRGVWIINNRDADVPEGVEHYSTRSLKAHILLGRANYVITNVNFAQWMHKREGATHVQTQHGTPLKTMGLHLRGRRAAPKMSYSALLARCSRWDYLLSSNPYSTEIWASAFPISYRTLELGYPRNDVLCNATDDDVRSARESIGVPPDATVILYAPTHREYDGEFVERLDIPALIELLPDDHVIAVRAHHSYSEAEASEHDRVLNVSDHPSIEELYLASDVLITDYSSVMFDYANLGRPIILYFDDFDRYNEARGMYIDIRESPPGPYAETQTELTEILVEERHRSPESMAMLERFRERFCPFDDGHAAERVVATVFGIEGAEGGE